MHLTKIILTQCLDNFHLDLHCFPPQNQAKTKNPGSVSALKSGYQEEYCALKDINTRNFLPIFGIGKVRRLGSKPRLGSIQEPLRQVSQPKPAPPLPPKKASQDLGRK